MNSVRKNLLIFFIFFLILLFSILLFNIVMDPYQLFGRNKLRPGYLTSASYIPKAVGIIHEKPNTIIIGTSIVDNAFRLPGSIAGDYDSGFNEKETRLESLIHPYLPIYNAGIRGGGLYETYTYILHAYKNNPQLKHIIIGVEWGVFTTARPPTPAFPTTPALNKTYVPYLLYIDKYLSWDSTYDSYQVFLLAHPHFLINIPKITQASSNLLNKAYLDFQQTKFSPQDINPSGDQLVHAHSAAQTAELYFSLWDLADRRQRLKNNGIVALVNPDALDYMQRIVKFTQEKHIKLDVYVSPAPAVYWATAKNEGVLPCVDKWLRKLVAITPYWDFSGKVDYSAHVSDYYPNDALHFNELVGEIILPTILHGKANPAQGINYVTPTNINAVIRYRHAKLTAWLNHNKYLRDIYASNNYAFFRNNVGDWKNVLPVPYEPEYKNYKMFRFLGQVWALPANQAPYDLRRLMIGDYKNALLGDSPMQLVAKIDALHYYAMH